MYTKTTINQQFRIKLYGLVWVFDPHPLSGYRAEPDRKSGLFKFRPSDECVPIFINKLVGVTGAYHYLGEERFNHLLCKAMRSKSDKISFKFGTFKVTFYVK